MDQSTNVSLNRVLFDSKEKTELHSRKVSRHCEQVNITNLRSQFRKKYGNKYKQECIYRDLSKIEKQVTLLSSCTGKDECLKNMQPENSDNTVSNQINTSPELTTQCHTLTTRESIEQVKYDINIDSTENNILSLSQEQMFLNNKSFPQLAQNPAKMAFNLNKLLAEDKDNDVNFIVPFSESTNKLNSENATAESNPNDCDNEIEYNNRMQKSKKSYATFELEGDSSGLFEFSLEGEKLVSSLCGPQSKGGRKDEGSQSNKLIMFNKSNQELNYADAFKGSSLDKSNNQSFLSKHLDIGMSFSNAVTSTPEKDNSNSIHEYHLHHEMISSSKTHEDNKIMLEGEHSMNKYGGISELTTESESNETKSVITKISSANRVEKKSVISLDHGVFGQNKRQQMQECSNNINLCSLFQANMVCENVDSTMKKSTDPLRSEDINKTNKSSSVPNIFSVINKFNQGKTYSIASNIEAQIHNEGEGRNETISDSCDDEISFRKSAIKGCLVFERIIKDLQITTFQNLENYCKSVKRCVSVASTMESRELSVLISELIFSFLKLADSWGIINSYFGESGNNEYKPQNLDDINLYQSFQDWQVKSKTLLEHLIVVVQNLKENSPKTTENEMKITQESQASKVSQYNPFLSQPQVKSTTVTSVNKNGMNSNFPIAQAIQKEENLNFQLSSQFQTQEIQFPKNIANIFSAHNRNNNWKPAITDNSQKKPDVYWEIPQANQANVFNVNVPSVPERKQRKKWTLTMPDFQNEASCPLVPNQGMAMQQAQPSAPLPPVNFQYVTQNKNPIENMMMQPINFFGSQYNTMPQNMQNIRENTSAAYNYCRPQTIYPNLKQSPKRKSNVNFKPEEQFHKDAMTGNNMYNRVNICNPQMQIPLLQNNVNPNPFGMIDEPKTNVIYQNFCIGDGKALPPTNTSYGTPFIQNEIYSANQIPNQNMFCHKTCEPKSMLPVPFNNCDRDDSSEEYYPVKSYMKPGSYRVPNKSKSTVAQSTNNLNYIFDDVLVTGITVPFTKSNIFSQSKKNSPKTVNTNEKSIQTNRPDEMRCTDLVWKAALASAEELGKSLICKQEEQNQANKTNQTCTENGSTKVQDNISDDAYKSLGDSQSIDSNSNNMSTEHIGNQQNKEESKQNEQEVTKSGSVKTDDWLIQSLSKLEGQPDSKEVTVIEGSRKNDTDNSSSTKSIDLKIKTPNSKSNESDESDNATNDVDVECYSPKDKGTAQKKDRYNGMKQKVSSNLKSVSILQKPREYCQSRMKPWEKARDFSYQIPPYKSDSRNIHKNPANWIKYNRKCINRQTLFKLQDILNSLSKMESSNAEHKESVNNHEHVNKIINVNAVNYKLKSHIYENIDQILLDIRQMFVNGRDANKECSKTIDLISKLETCFDELIEKHFGQSDMSENRELSQNGSSLAIKNRRTHKVQRKLN